MKVMRLITRAIMEDADDISNMTLRLIFILFFYQAGSL